MKTRESQFKILEDQKAEILRRLEVLTPERRNQAPGTDTWTPAQVAYHLMRAEELLPAAPNNAPTRRKPIFFIGILLMKLAVPIPSKAIEEPSGDLEISELIKRWNESRTRLRSELGTKSPTERAAEHPVFGALSLDSYLVMLDAHLTYHLKRWPS
jgi:hypothetical protein